MADVVRFAMYRERHDIISTFLMASEQQQQREIYIYTFEGSFAKVIRQVESFYGERSK